MTDLSRLYMVYAAVLVVRNLDLADVFFRKYLIFPKTLVRISTPRLHRYPTDQIIALGHSLIFH